MPPSEEAMQGSCCPESHQYRDPISHRFAGDSSFQFGPLPALPAAIVDADQREECASLLQEHCETACRVFLHHVKHCYKQANAQQSMRIP